MTAGEESGPAREEELRATLGRTRRTVVTQLAAVLALTGAAAFLPAGSRAVGLTAPATLIGLVSPVIGYRLYLWQRERLAPDTALPARCRAFFRATVTALGIAEAAAVFGVVVYALSARASALVGVVTLVTLAGAVWPSPERLATFIEPAAETGRP